MDIEPHEWAERFEQFAARKTRAALEAPLAPFRTEADNAGAAMEWIDCRWSHDLFDGPFYLSPLPAEGTAVSLVLVQSRNGNTGADDPSSLGGGETDKHLVYEGLSRVKADGVMAGAETLRGSDDVLFSVWHPEMIALRQSLGLPRHPTQIVVTRRGLDPSHLLLMNVPSIPVVVIAASPAAALMAAAIEQRPWIRLVRMKDPVDLWSTVDGLSQHGIRRVSVVGGRTVAAALLDAATVRDLYLTTSALDGGQPHTPLFSRPPARDLVVRKRGTHADGGVVFEHWRLTQNSGTTV